ncbi:MAG: hypothetical protein HY303_17055, partial [Candidatus Wallbacteria bacterium]|nr:hypothetical protein [Candidatus Wallbacteria bacterium]
TGAVTIAATGEDGAITVGATSNPVPRPGQICFDVNNNGTPAESADITYLLNKSINRVVTRNSVTTDFRVCPAGTNNNGDQTCFDINQNGTPAESADITYLLNKSINRVVTRNSVTTDFRTCPAYTGP